MRDTVEHKVVTGDDRRLAGPKQKEKKESKQRRSQHQQQNITAGWHILSAGHKKKTGGQ